MSSSGVERRERCTRSAPWSAASRPASVTSSGSRTGRTGATSVAAAAPCPAAGANVAEVGPGLGTAAGIDQLRRSRPRRRSGRATAPAPTGLPRSAALAVRRRSAPAAAARRLAGLVLVGRQASHRGAPPSAPTQRAVPTGRVEQLAQRDAEADDQAEHGERRRAGRTRRAGRHEVAQRFASARPDPAAGRRRHADRGATTCATPRIPTYVIAQAEERDPPARSRPVAGPPLEPPARQRAGRTAGASASVPNHGANDVASTSRSGRPRPGSGQGDQRHRARARAAISPRIERTTSGVSRDVQRAFERGSAPRRRERSVLRAAVRRRVATAQTSTTTGKTIGRRFVCSYR